MKPHAQRRKAYTLKRVLYTLRRRYGSPSALYQVSSSFDIETGANSDTITRVKIPSLVSWDVSFSNQIPTHSLGNFNYGFNYQAGDRVAVLDRKYSSLSPTDYFVIDNLRYDIVKYVVLDYDVGYIVHLRHTNNQVPRQITDKQVSHFLTTTQEIT